MVVVVGVVACAPFLSFLLKMPMVASVCSLRSLAVLAVCMYTVLIAEQTLVIGSVSRFNSKDLLALSSFSADPKWQVGEKRHRSCG